MHYIIRSLALLLVFGVFCLSCQPAAEAVPERDPAEVARVLAAVDRAAADKELYNRALRENSRKAYDAYLAAFPEGEFSAAAREHLENRNNRELQARYALDFVMRTLRATKKAPRIGVPATKGTFQPSVATSIKRMQRKLEKDLQTCIERSSDRLPGVYLDQLRKNLQSGKFYSEEPTGQLNSHKGKVKKLYPPLVFGIKHPLQPLYEEHLRQCSRETTQLIKRFRAQGKKAVVGLERFGV